MAWALKWAKPFEIAGVIDPQVWLTSMWSTIHHGRDGQTRPGESRASWSADVGEALTFGSEAEALALRDCGSNDWRTSVAAVEVEPAAPRMPMGGALVALTRAVLGL